MESKLISEQEVDSRQPLNTIDIEIQPDSQIESSKRPTSLSPSERKQKQLILASLLVCNFAAQSLYMNVCSLLPEFVNQNFPKLNNFDVGLLMAVYPIAFLFTAPFIGGHMGNFGRKNSVLAGVILMTLATLMFGMASYASSEFWFFTVSFIGRTLQGIADAIIGVSIPSIIALEFPDKQELYLGFVSMSMGAGLCLGPAFGAIVFRFLNYVDTFYFFTMYIFSIGLASVYVLPSRINDKITQTAEQQANPDCQITYRQILSNRRALTATIVCTLSFICIMFMDPILAVRLTSMGMQESNVGYAFAVIGISLTIGSPIAGWLCEKVSRIVVMQIGLVTMGFSILLAGPSVLLGFPNMIWLMLIGIFFMGFFGAFCYVPVTPEIIDAVAIKEKSRWRRALQIQGVSESEIPTQVELKFAEINGELVDKASALQNMAFALGSAIAPVLGGKLTDLYGFRRCSDIIAGFTFFCALLNFGVIFLPNLICIAPPVNEKEQMEHLSGQSSQNELIFPVNEEPPARQQRENTSLLQDSFVSSRASNMSNQI